LSAALFAGGRIPPRRPGTDTPIASAERLAKFARRVLGADHAAICRELLTWRDREALPLSDALLLAIAAHVALDHTREAA